MHTFLASTGSINEETGCCDDQQGSFRALWKHVHPSRAIATNIPRHTAAVGDSSQQQGNATPLISSCSSTTSCHGSDGRGHAGTREFIHQKIQHGVVLFHSPAILEGSLFGRCTHRMTDGAAVFSRISRRASSLAWRDCTVVGGVR